MVDVATLQVWTTKPDKREQWGAGPWVDEPDKAQWDDMKTGLTCLALRHYRGFWCAYVGVPPGHPLHGVDHGDRRVVRLRVHGEVSYSARCQEDTAAPMEERICHVPRAGEPDDLWWFGFACGYGWDYDPWVAAEDRSALGTLLHDVDDYRTLAYVQDQCSALAEQLNRYSSGRARRGRWSH